LLRFGLFLRNRSTLPVTFVKSKFR
jgi:hypothetical protein